MRRYELLPHVADVRLFVEGDSLKELFTAALEGMCALIKENACKEPYSLQEVVKLSAPDGTALLIDFLADVLTYSHINKAVYCKVEFDSLKSTECQATIFGLSVDSFDEDVKAVTYHEARIQKNKANNYECTVIFDI